MKSSSLFSILPVSYKTSPAFSDWKNKTVFSFIKYVNSLKKPNKHYLLAYELCRKYVAENPELMDNFESIDLIPVNDPSTIQSISQQMEFSPNQEDRLPLLIELKKVLSDMLDSMKRKATTRTQIKKVEYFHDYFFNNLSIEELMSKNDLKSSESINLKMRKLSNSLLNPASEKEFRFSQAYVEYLNQMKDKFSCSNLEGIDGELGIEDDPLNRILNRFLKLDVLKWDFDVKIIVPLENVTKIRESLHEIYQELKKAFGYIPFGTLLEFLPETLTKEEKEKLLNSFLHGLNTIEFSEDGVRIQTLFLETVYVRQARLIYDSDKPMTFREIQEKYEAIYEDSIESLTTNMLNKCGFFCNGGINWYYGEAQTLRQFIAKYVSDHKFSVRLSNIKEAIKEKFNTSDKTIECYLGEICYRSKDDSDLYCHKDHLAEFPGFKIRKEQNSGQERKVVIAIWKYLNNSPEGVKLKELKKWVLAFMKDEGLNYKMSSKILNTYIEKGIFISEGDIIKRNIDFDEKKLSFIGRGKNLAKYADQIISIGVNELQKSPANRMLFADLVSMILDSIIGLNRNIIKTLFEETDEFNVEKIDGRIYISLAIEIEAEPIYEMSQEAPETEAQLVEVAETREPLAPNITFDWDRIIAKLMKELSFYVRKDWFGEDFDLNEGLILFRKFLSESKNQNLSVRLPQDMHEYWFCATSHYDRNRYFSDLAIFFESVLRELYPHKMEFTRGLEDVVSYFPAIKELGDRPKEDRLAGSYRDLKYQRNQVAHGTFVELTSRQEAEKIINYIALYVYTIATKGEGYRS